MSQQTHTQTTLARSFHLYIDIGADLLLALAAGELEWRISPSTPSPKDRFFAWRSTEDDADHPATWLIPSLLLPPEPCKRIRVVPLLSGCTGILNAIESFRQVFP